MSRAPFIDRVGDALVGSARGSRESLLEALDAVSVEVTLSPMTATGGRYVGTVETLGRLLARLYPGLIVAGDAEAVTAFTVAARAVNPGISIQASPAAPTITTAIGPGALFTLGVNGSDPVTVAVEGWNVHLDTDPPADAGPPATSLVCLAAVALGAGYLFRTVFADVLPHGRTGPEPATLNLVTLGPATPTPEPVASPDLGALHLAGAGAIGQAVVLGLAAHARSHGMQASVTVIDPEQIGLSNLQRYPLSVSTDIGATKTEFAVAHLRAAGITAFGEATRWGHGPASQPGQDTVLAALDTAQDRLMLAAGGHHRVYNAFTGLADIGWSRHEQPGVTACIGCLYYPTSRRPDRHQEIADALGIDPLRALAYLAARTPVGQPLPMVTPVADLPAPPGHDWLKQDLLTALVLAGKATAEQAAVWQDRDIEDLYRDGVCGGALVGLDQTGEHVVVPLAHHSLLAGLMLALQPILAADPVLAGMRPEASEARLSPLAPLPQQLARPRVPTRGCLCSDPDYLPT